MKINFSQQSKKGFTLIELLVVIVILGALAAVSYPLITSFMEKGDITKANKTCKDLASAASTYYQDNTDLPINWDKVSEDAKVVELSTDGENDADLVHILFYTETGKELTAGNNSRKAYIKADSVKEKADGLYQDGELAALYDPWGQPYHIILNLADPEQGSLTDPFDNSILQNEFCIVYSTGPDAKGQHHAIEANQALTSAQVSAKTSKKNDKKGKKGKKGKAEESDAESKLAYPAYSEEENEAIEDNVYSWKTVD